MCKVNKDIQSKIQDFVHGYIAGSCVSFDQALTVLHESLINEEISITVGALETMLSQELADAELFCCENCNWWCYEHDRSEEGTYCSDCDPDEE